MNRRGFLQGILAAGVAPAVVSASNLMVVKKPLQIATLEEVMTFGMAPIKAEGANMLYDNAVFTRALWPGVAAWYGEEYKNLQTNWRIFKES